MFKSISPYGCLVALAAICGCAVLPPHAGKAPPYTPDSDRVILVGAAEDAGSGTPPGPVSDYASRVLRPGDKITINLVGIPKPQSFPVVIDEAGDVNLPFIEDVNIGDRTRSEAERIVERAYVDGEIYRYCTVMIIPPDTMCWVQGEVNKPGGFPLTGPLTVLQALSNAGGFTDFARPTKIKVIRQGSDPFYINAIAIQKGRQPDLPVQPGDILVVPRRWP